MEPKDFGRALLRRKSTVLTALVVVLVIGAFTSFRKQPTYASQCIVHFGAILADPSDPESKPIDNIGNPFSQISFIKSGVNAILAAKTLTGPDVVTPEEILSKVDTKVLTADGGPTQNWQITVADKPPAAYPTPKGMRAAKICNAVADSYIQYQKDFARDFFQKRLKQNQTNWDETDKRIKIALQALADLNLNISSGKGTIQQRARWAVDREDLKVQADSLLNTRVSYSQKIEAFRNQLINGIDGGSEIVNYAGPGAPVGADHKKDLTLALIMGLIFGIGIVLLREYLDDTVRDKESTQRELGIPVLSNLPETAAIDGMDGPSSQTLEAARTLRATLASIGVPQEKSVLLITSSLAKSRSATLVSLASAFAESGRSVLVIGSDFRGGRTHESFGVSNTNGLANVIRGQAAFERAIRPAPGVEGVYVMPCGPVIGNPGELLSSEEMAMTLARARRWADVVLLDAPPVLTAADSSILGAYADGVVMVVSAGRTNRHQAIEAKEQLIAAGARVLGAVLVGSDDPAQSEGGYGDGMDNVMPFWGSGYEPASNAYEDWYSEEVVTASARTTPRQRSQTRREPAKKTAASRPKQRPKAETARVPRGGVKGRATSRVTPSRTAKRPAPKGSTPARASARANASTKRRSPSPARKEKPRATRAQVPATRAPRPTPISKRRYT